MKDRKITFHTIEKKMYKDNAEGIDGFVPFFEIIEVLEYIKERKRRVYSLKGNKACSLDSYTVNNNDDSNFCITGFFRSADHKYRPPYWDVETDEERDSPKKVTEGELEKTHFGIKVTKRDVFLILETNGKGITINNVTNYLNDFTKQYLKRKKKTKNFKVSYTKLPKENFIAQLNKLQRAMSIDVTFDKQLVGGRALNFSDKTYNMQDEVKLLIKAERDRSITEVGVDIFNKYNSQDPNKGISRIRIHGKDENNEDTYIDTSFMEKMEWAKVSIIQSTGQVRTTDIYRYLRAYLENL